MLFRIDLEEAEDAVRALISIELEQYEFDALVSFTFNLGFKRLKESTLRTMLNRGERENIPAQIKRWIYSANKDGIREVSNGLMRRRSVEAQLFAYGKILEWPAKRRG